MRLDLLTRWQGVGPKGMRLSVVEVVCGHELLLSIQRHCSVFCNCMLFCALDQMSICTPSLHDANETMWGQVAVAGVKPRDRISWASAWVIDTGISLVLALVLLSSPNLCACLTQ